MRSIKYKLLVIASGALCLFLNVAAVSVVQAAAATPSPTPAPTPTTTGQPVPNVSYPSDAKYHCGGPPSTPVRTTIDIGCKGVGNPITDMAFAIIRVLSYGVGLVIIASIVVGGLQYTASRGDPKATAQAVERLRSTFIALVIYIFGFAILNYLIPVGFLKQ